MRRFAFAQVDSTSTRAAELAAAHPGEALLITAQTQTAGRGRTGRPWASPLGGAWFTLVWPTARAPETYEPAPLVAGLAVRDTILDFGLQTSEGVHPTTCDPLPAPPSSVARTSDLWLKWPNDVLLGGRKIAGILCERLHRPNLPAALLIGVGINANFDPVLLPSDLRYPATTLRAALGRDIDLEALIHTCARRLVERLQRLEQAGLDAATLTELNACLAFREQSVTVQTLAGTHTGRCRGVDARGAFQLDTPSGPISLTTGEVTRVSCV